MKVLLHTCCAPCSVYCIETLRKEGIEPVSYWFNPNIHPFVEYKARRDCLIEYSKMIDLNLIVNENYGLRDFCENVSGDIENRCQKYCYPIRMEETAKYAKDNGYNAFCTTLLVSPYQRHEEIKIICEKMAKKYEISFLYRDFRTGFREGQEKAKELGLYRQKYCGCVFSEFMAKDDRKSFENKVQLQNKITERKIRLSWDVPNLELKPYKNGNQEEIQFIYNLKREVYQEYVEKYFSEWNEENQQKLFSRFMKENAKNIELIYLKDELVRIL